MQFSKEHEEVKNELLAIGKPHLASQIGPYRRSQLEYCGVSVPTRRRCGRRGFSFSILPHDQLRAIWHELWMHSSNGDVMSCALDYFKDHWRKDGIQDDLWPMVRQWVERVENWAHADDLCTLYSRIVEERFNEVFPDLELWNQGEALWPKRISIVSLIHNTGKNAVFLPLDTVLPMVSRCVNDHRDYMQKATGWVLRELHSAHPIETELFIQECLHEIGAQALSRAFERAPPDERAKWRLRRTAAQTPKPRP